MCGRFDLDRTNKEISKLIDLLPPNSPPFKTSEVFPTNPALTLIKKDETITPEIMVWGFPRWDGHGVVINARAETALQKSMFRNALKRQPAVIPTTGFYEWKLNNETGKKDKFLFRANSTDPLYLAGIWNTFSEEPFPAHFTILTTTANPAMADYHSRMPILLQANEIEPWLEGKNLTQILTRQPFSVSAEKR